MDKGFRKISTRRGTYFVAWRPEDVSQLLECERFSPGELDTGNSNQLHHFLRDLYLLACRASVRASAGDNSTGHRVLVRFARELHAIYRSKNT